MIKVFDKSSSIGWLKKTLPSGGGADTPAAAYSLRNVVPTWFGRSLINVRRSGDNAEKEFSEYEIESGIMEDWITSGGLVARDAFIVTWYDQSGNGNHATQSADASQPKIWDSSTGLVTENGKPALDFDGVDDHLILLGTGAGGANPLNVNSDLLCAMVLKPTTSKSAYVFNNYQGSTAPYTGQHILWHQDPDGSDVTFETSYDDDSTPSTLVSTGQPLARYIVTNIRNKGGTNYIYINGAENTSGADTATGDVISDIDWAIGARAEDATVEVWEGNIQELIIYSTDQSANRTILETNINDYYNIF